MKCYTDNQGRNPKRLFVSLMTGSFVALVAVFVAMWWIARPGLLELNSWLPEAFGLCLLVLAGLMALGIFSMVAGIMGWPVPRWCVGNYGRGNGLSFLRSYRGNFSSTNCHEDSAQGGGGHCL